MTSTEARVYLALGSNIEPEANLRAAIRLLGEQCRVLALSPVYRSAAQGFSEQPDFLNMAALVVTGLTPSTFKAQVIGSIETRLGRVRDPQNKNAPRTIDLDIALWDHAIIEYDGKMIPDPDIYRYAHVAVPLADLAPDYAHPETGETLAQIAASFESSTLRAERLDFGSG